MTTQPVTSTRRHRPRPTTADYDRALARTSEVLYCDRPPEPGEVMCRRCIDNLAALLRDDVADVVLEVNVSRAGEQGIDYRSLGGATGGSKTVPLIINERAIDARDRLRRVLRSLVLGCLAGSVRSDDTSTVVPPRGDVPAMASWLLHRVDAMALHQEFAAAAWDVADAVEFALHVVDRPATRQDLGACPDQACAGRLSAVKGAALARCSVCSTQLAAQPIRDGVVAELRGRLCTAAEIATLSAYLALRADLPHRIQARIWQWRRRGLVIPADIGPNLPYPPATIDVRDLKSEPTRYRFGDVFDRLMKHETSGGAR